MRRLESFDPLQLTKYGLQQLRESVAGHLTEHENIQSDAANVLIVPSLIVSADLIHNALTGSRANFLCEKAAFVKMVTNIHSFRKTMFGLPMDENGIKLDALAQQLAMHPYAVLHIDPADQVPTGIASGDERLRLIMELVKKYRIPVIEVGHLRDVWNEKPYPPSLKSRQGGENVIYTGSFIRSYPLDMRVSWVVAEQRVIEHLTDADIQMDLRVGLFQQLVADEIFRRGEYHEVMAAIRDFVRKRRILSLQMCEHYLHDCATWEPRHCLFHFWIRLKGMNTRVLFERKRFDTFAPGYFFDGADSEHVLLCPPSLEKSTLEKAIKQIRAFAGTG
ncbi:MAG: hypothetical protein LBB60_12000 [Desulfovibrio sp.]|jgi:GntR family transcriptional regulator of abcA and norABC|nr:hypothetical protein [Desulfovibrio sp.]